MPELMKKVSYRAESEVTPSSSGIGGTGQPLLLMQESKKMKRTVKFRAPKRKRCQFRDETAYRKFGDSDIASGLVQRQLEEIRAKFPERTYRLSSNGQDIQRRVGGHWIRVPL